MKRAILFLSLIISSFAPLHAKEPIQYRLEFSYEGFDSKWIADLSDHSRLQAKIENGTMPFFYAVARSGQEASIQLLAEAPTNSEQNQRVDNLCGAVIHFTVVSTNDELILSGTSRLRRTIPSDVASKTWTAFETEEAFFNSKIELGKSTLVATTGEKANQTRLMVRAVAIDPTGQPITR